MTKLKHVTEHDGSQWVELEIAEEMAEALEQTTRELQGAIGKINEMLKSEITSYTENEPDYWDYQTVHESSVTLAKARGDL